MVKYLPLLFLFILLLPAYCSLKIGIIADELVDYSTWAKPFASLWKGEEVLNFLKKFECSPQLLTADELSFEGFSKYDVILIVTDHTYPEMGSWGGVVAEALKKYVEQGGIYAMPIGVPHYISKDIKTGKLDSNHWEDFFGWRASVCLGSGELKLTKQGK